MSVIRRRGIHYFQKLNSPNVPTDLIHKGQNRVIDASHTLIRERAKVKVELWRLLRFWGFLWDTTRRFFKARLLLLLGFGRLFGVGAQTLQLKKGRN